MYDYSKLLRRLAMARVVVLLGLLVFASAQCSAQQAASDSPPSTVKDELRMIKIFRLANIEAESAASTLRELFSEEQNLTITADSSTNSILVRGTEASLESVGEVLPGLDQTTAKSAVGENASKTLLLSDQRQLPSSQAEAQVAVKLARQQNIEFEFIPELQIAVVRGSESSIQAFLSTLENFKQSLHRTEDDGQARDTGNVLTHIIWLLSTPGEAELESDESFEAIRRKAEQSGIRDLIKVGQLMATSSRSAEKPSTFQVTGTAEAADQIFEMSAGGTVARIESAEGEERYALMLEMSVRADAQLGKSTGAATAKVSMQVVAGQPVMIASAPVFGRPSIFVVKLDVPE